MSGHEYGQRELGTPQASHHQNFGHNVSGHHLVGQAGDSASAMPASDDAAGSHSSADACCHAASAAVALLETGKLIADYGLPRQAIVRPYLVLASTTLDPPLRPPRF